MEQLDPSLTSPYTESDEPARTIDLIDRDDPRVSISNTLHAEPIWVTPYTLMLEPSLMKLRPEIAEPNET